MVNPSGIEGLFGQKMTHFWRCATYVQNFFQISTSWNSEVMNYVILFVINFWHNQFKNSDTKILFTIDLKINDAFLSENFFHLAFGERGENRVPFTSWRYNFVPMLSWGKIVVWKIISASSSVTLIISIFWVILITACAQQNWLQNWRIQRNHFVVCY